MLIAQTKSKDFEDRPIDNYALTTNLGTSLVHTSPKTISAKPVRASLCNPILKDRSCTADSRQDTAKMQSCPGEWDFLPWALELIDAQVLYKKLFSLKQQCSPLASGRPSLVGRVYQQGSKIAYKDTQQDSLIHLRSRCPMICKSHALLFAWPSECIHASGRHVCLLAASLVQRTRHSDLHMKTGSNVILKLMLNDWKSCRP